MISTTYYKVRIDGNVRDCATLIAIGIRRDNGKRLVLGVSCALSEAEVHWRDFLTSLRQRDLGIPDSVTSDAHVGLRAALRAIVENCRRLGINPKEYLTDVLTRLPGMLAKDAVTLTPANWLNARSGKPER